MRIILSILSMLIVNSCNVTSLFEAEDCAGVAGGSAAIDECGSCTSGETGLTTNYLKDCGGNGGVYIDNYGYYDKNYSNDCVQDCNSI